MNDKTLSPAEYFEMIKGKRYELNEKSLQEKSLKLVELAEKFKRTNQVEGLKKILFYIDHLKYEELLLTLGFNQLIHRDTLHDYITSVKDNQVKVYRLKDFEREIPDEICDVINKTKGIFDEFYILCLDPNIHKKVCDGKSEKDPILLGAFEDKATKMHMDHYFYLGDWVDEYCDLTLMTFIDEYSGERNISPVSNLSLAKMSDSIRAYINDSEKDFQKEETSFLGRLSSAVANFIMG